MSYVVICGQNEVISKDLWFCATVRLLVPNKISPLSLGYIFIFLLSPIVPMSAYMIMQVGNAYSLIWLVTTRQRIVFSLTGLTGKKDELFSLGQQAPASERNCRDFPSSNDVGATLRTLPRIYIVNPSAGISKSVSGCVLL